MPYHTSAESNSPKRLKVGGKKKNKNNSKNRAKINPMVGALIHGK